MCAVESRTCTSIGGASRVGVAVGARRDRREDDGQPRQRGQRECAHGSRDQRPSGGSWKGELDAEAAGLGGAAEGSGGAVEDKIVIVAAAQHELETLLAEVVAQRNPAVDAAMAVLTIHPWDDHRERGEASPLEDYSLQAAAARLGKFMRPINVPSGW